MGTLKERLTSRKFLLAVAGCVGYLLLAIAGILSWDVAMNGIKTLIMVYLGVEGGADIASRVCPRPE